MAAQDARDLLGGATGPRVDDRRAAVRAGEALDEDLESVVRVRDLLDVVAEVRRTTLVATTSGVAAERLADLARGLGRRRRRHPEERRLAEGRERVPDEEVVGAEVVPPHAHAVRLVDDDEADADRAEESRKPACRSRSGAA